MANNMGAASQTTRRITFHWNVRVNPKGFSSSPPPRPRRDTRLLSSLLPSPLPSSSNSNSPNASLPIVLSPLDENYFLNQVETTIARVFRQQQQHGDPNDVNILDLPKEQREAFGIGRNLDKRLKSLRKNNDCPRCWMQRKHCICSACPSVVNDGSEIHGSNDYNSGSLKRIFLVMHHKEIGLKVDTAKLILSSFPFQSKLVVGGIGPEHQHSMQEMLESIHDSKRTTLLLFPDETAKTLAEIVNPQKSTREERQPSKDCEKCKEKTQVNERSMDTYDIIVLDGTWAQARKFHSRYFPSDESPPSLQRVQLSEGSVDILNKGSTETGHQLRRHDIAWRQVGTFEAFRLFMRDWSREFAFTARNDEFELWKQIESYQRISNDAALRELGPPRFESK